MPNRPSRIEISIPSASFDGRYYGRYPHGDAPPTGLASDAVSSAAATARLRNNPIALASAASSSSSGAGDLTTGGGTGAPAWYTALTKGQWKAVSGGSSFGSTFQNGPRIADASAALGSPPGHTFTSTAFHNISSAWNGMTVDQVRGAPVMLANGGHADYAGNEGYIWLKAPPGGGPPGWYMFIMPTPESSLVFAPPGGGPAATYLDGRPRSMHNGPSYCYADGKIWLGYQGPYFSGGGGSTECQWVFDMQDSGVSAAITAGTALAWDGTAGPWTDLGPAYTDGVGYGYLTTAVYDPVGKRVWFATGFGFDRSITNVWYLNTTGGSIGTGATFTLNGGNPYADFSWAVCCPDLGIIVQGDGSVNQSFVVFEIAHAGGALGTWYYRPGIDSGAGSVSGSGIYGVVNNNFPWAVYQQIDHSILIMDPTNNGNTMYKLKIPMSGSSYNKAGVWTWSNFATPGDTLVFFDSNPFGSRTTDKCLNKFNVINDMGDGTSALFFCGGIGPEDTNLGGVQGAASFNIPSFILPLPSAGM